MRFIFSTGSLYTYGTERCFELAARAGFDAVEVLVDQRWDTRQPEHLNRLMDRYSLPVYAVHAPLERAAIHGWPEDGPGRVRATVRLAEAVGAEVVVHHLPLRLRTNWLQIGSLRVPLPRLGRDAYRDWLSGDYGALQAATPAKLCIENLPAVRLIGHRLNPGAWNDAAQITRFSSLTLDTTHLGTWGLDPLEVYELLGPRVQHVHLSNFDGREHRRPEDGHLRLDRLVARLAANGYEGAISIETAPDALEAGKPDDKVAALMAGSLAYCRQAAAL